MQRINIDINDLLEMRSDGKTIADMAEKYHVSMSTITHRLMENNVSMRKDVPTEEELRKLAKTMTAADIAVKYMVDITTIYHLAWRYGGIKFHRKRTEIDIQKIVSLLESGVTKTDVAKQFNTSVSVINKRLEEIGWKQKKVVRTVKGRRCTPSNNAECLYSSGGYCMYLIIEGHRRPCLPSECTCYKRATQREKMAVHSKFGISKKGVGLIE